MTSLVEYVYSDKPKFKKMPKDLQTKKIQNSGKFAFFRKPQCKNGDLDNCPIRCGACAYLDHNEKIPNIIKFT